MFSPTVCLRSALVPTTLLLLSPGCRSDPARLDAPQEVAYRVKPAVVRVSALARASMKVESSAIQAVGRELERRGYPVRLSPPEEPTEEVKTGAGGSASGFVVNPSGWIMTSGHAVAITHDRARLEAELRRNGAIAVLLRHFDIDVLRDLTRRDELNRIVEIVSRRATLAEVQIADEVELSNGFRARFELVRLSPSIREGGADLAVLRIRRNNLPSLPFADSETVQVGASVWAVGYPSVASSTDEVIGGWLSRESDLEATFNPGTITAIKRNAASQPLFQTNVAIYPGNSGGPVVDSSGRVVGISALGHTSAEQIRFMVPSSVAKIFLARAGVRPDQEGEFDQQYRQALDAAASGRWILSKKHLARAGSMFPGSPDLVRFSRDVERAVSGLSFWQVHPLGTVAAGALLVLLFAAIASSVPSLRAALRQRQGAEIAVQPFRGSPPSGGRAATSGPRLGRLTILNGERAGQKLGLGASGIRIGRESAICEIILENPKVSRLHAEIVEIDGKVMLIDRNSSNGTFVNDRKVDRHVLEDGDIIHFGGRNAVGMAFHR